MICSINLNNKTILERDKVDYVHPNYMLTPEMHPKFATAKLFPDKLFCIRHFPAVFYSIILYRDISKCIGSFPSFPTHLFM